MSLELELLRERLPESLRMRLPSDDGLGSWLEALGPDLADVLRELSPSAMEASLGELVQLGGEALPVLLRLEEHAPDKQQRKLVRRCLHRLRSHGVDVGAPWRGERRSVLAPLGEAAEQGALTPPDPLGRRAIFLLVPVQRGTRIYELLLSDVEGVLHLERVETRRRDARSFLRRLREEHQARLLRVEGPSLRALVLQTLESVSGSTAPDVDPKLLAQLLAGKRTETPGEQVRAKLLDAARCLAQGQAEAILRGRVERGVLPAWPLTGEAVQETVRQLAQLERSQLVLSGVQKRERVQEVLSRAAAQILDDTTCERLARRLEETAGFLQQGDEEGAAAAVRMAEIIRRAGVPLEVGYLRTLLELSCALSGQQQREEDEGKLILPG